MSFVILGKARNERYVSFQIGTSLTGRVAQKY